MPADTKTYQLFLLGSCLWVFVVDEQSAPGKQLSESRLSNLRKSKYLAYMSTRPFLGVVGVGFLYVHACSTIFHTPWLLASLILCILSHFTCRFLKNAGPPNLPINLQPSFMRRRCELAFLTVYYVAQYEQLISEGSGPNIIEFHSSNAVLAMCHVNF